MEKCTMELDSPVMKPTSNRRWSEKCIIDDWKKYVVAILLFVSVILILLISSVLVKFLKNGYDVKISDVEICYTLECNKSASLLSNYMNTSIDPCEDFYEFACGNYALNAVLPDDRLAVNLFSEVNDIVEQQLKMIVEEPVTEAEIAPFRFMKNLYKSCMDTDAINKIGKDAIMRYLPKIGGWPVLNEKVDDWNENEFSWIDTIYKFRKHGYSADFLFDLSVLVDMKNSSINRIQISEPLLTLKKEYFAKGLNDDVIQEYYKYMVDIPVLFGADRKNSESEMKDVLLFEMALSNITTSMEEHRANLSRFYNLVTIDQAETKFPFVPWLEYINEILSPVEKVEGSEMIVISAWQYLVSLKELLGITPKRVQANYLAWRAVQSTVAYLSDNIRHRQQKFIAVMYGVSQQPPRSMECVNVASASFYIAAGSKYVQKYFKNESKAEALEMVQNIRRVMYDTLRSVDWMDDFTRKNALEKAYKMTYHIAYPEELLNVTNLNEIYKRLHIEAGDYYGAAMNVSKFTSDYMFSKLRQPINKTDWRSHSQVDTVNAMYKLSENSIQFPAGILQHMFFEGNRPKYLNYGAIGFIIGHEVTHAFDDKGSQFDKEGNLVNWWNNKTWNKYLEKSKCIINQYGNYTVEEVNMKINGINTQGENLADNNGVRTAYVAYKNWSQNNPPEPQLPNMPYSPLQMFWISAATIWCDKRRTPALKQQMLTDNHPPSKYRVIGSFSNQIDFSRDFSCSDGSKMNPSIRCRVW